MTLNTCQLTDRASRSFVQIDEGNLWDRCILLQVSDREDDRVWCVTRVASPGVKHLSISFYEACLSAGSKMHFLVDNRENDSDNDSDAFIAFTLEPPSSTEINAQNAESHLPLKGQFSTPPLRGTCLWSGRGKKSRTHQCSGRYSIY